MCGNILTGVAESDFSVAFSPKFSVRIHVVFFQISIMSQLWMDVDSITALKIPVLGLVRGDG